MSLLGKVVEFVASDAIADVVDTSMNILEKSSEKSKQKSDDKLKKIFAEEPGKEILLIHQHRFTWKDKIDIYNGFNSIKYTAKGELASVKHHLHIYNSAGIEVGTIKEKLISLRAPLSFDVNPVDFILEIGGREIGMLKSKSVLGKQKYEFDFNGWIIEGNLLGWKYKILSGNEVIADISQKVLSNGDTYIINFNKNVGELLVLMLVLAIDAANAPTRGEEIKKTARHKMGLTTKYR